jgi:SAM-dependent methyltransferase
MSFVHYEQGKQRVDVNPAHINPLSYLSSYWLVKAIAQVRSYASGKLLDIGCSTKPYRALLAAEKHIGIDWPQTIHKHTQIDAFADASVLPFRDGAFQTILCTEVLEHLKTPQQALSEMARVAAPRAHLILSVPFTFRIHEQPHDFFRYTPFALRYLLDQAGFEVIDITPRGGILSVWLDIGFRGSGTLINRALKAVRLRGRALRLAQDVLLIAPQWACVRLIELLHRAAPRVARHIDPSEHYTLGYVVIAIKR